MPSPAQPTRGTDFAGTAGPLSGARPALSGAVGTVEDLVPEQLLAAAAAAGTDGLAVVDGGGEIRWANAALERLGGWAPGALAGERLDAIGLRTWPGPRALAGAPTGAADLAGPLSGTLLQPDRPTRMQVGLRRADGGVVPVRVGAAPVRSEGRHWWVLSVNETEHGHAHELTAAAEERFRALAADAPLGVACSEVGLRLGWVNDRLVEQFGRARDRLLGTGWLDAIHPEDLPDVVGALSGVLVGEEGDVEARVPQSVGDPRWFRLRARPLHHGSGRGAAFVLSAEDVTDRHAAQDEQAWRAVHDPLTSLPNRADVQRRLREMLERGGALAVLLLDIDDFKLVNEVLGHDHGDALLVELAERLRLRLRHEDVVGRTGGDEFVVLCPGLATESEVTAVARRLLAAVAEPHQLAEREVRITASVGIVRTDGHHSAEHVLRDADVALYQAKGSGKARFALFDEHVRASVEERFTLVSDLRHALAAGEITVAYQPVVRVSDGGVESVEALVRWPHPTRGQVSPAEMIPLAEQTGLISDVGSYVLREALRQLASWRARHGASAPRYVAVNLSIHQLTHPSLVTTVADALAANGLAGSDLCLELTESILMVDAPSAIDVLARLRALGVRLAIDDFGTGYSSLAYLKRFKVDLVKVDRSFVSGLPDAEEDAAIVRAVIGMAQALGLSVVAEGVETPEQLSTLASLGCTFAQGYHLGRPAPPGAIGDRLRAAEEPSDPTPAPAADGGADPSAPPAPLEPLRRT